MDLICKSSRNLPKPRSSSILRNFLKPRGFPIHRNLLPKPRGLPNPKFFPGLGSRVRNSVRSGGCSSGYTIGLEDKGNEHHPDIAGDYEEVCSENGVPIYR